MLRRVKYLFWNNTTMTFGYVNIEKHAIDRLAVKRS
jgi:hypothetical protein